MDEWQQLNERQQTYLRAIFVQDQAQESNERLRAAMDQRTRPADEWRWVLYANTEYGHTPLKQALKDAGMVDPGTGSTFKALEERGYLLVHSEGATSHRRSELIVNVRLTTKGRRLVRKAQDIKTPARLPTGTLREWHWRALCRGYVRGEEGMGYDKDEQDGFGYVSWKTCLRLRDYRTHGEEKPLIGEKRFPGERTSPVGGYAFKQDYEARLCITDFGKQYYRENWQRYRDLYPTVNAPAPGDLRCEEQQNLEQEDQVSQPGEQPLSQQEEAPSPRHAGGRPRKDRVRVNIKLTPRLQQLTENIDRSQLIIDVLNTHFGITEERAHN